MKSVFLIAVLCCVVVSGLAHRGPMRPNSRSGHDDSDGDNGDENQYFKLFKFMDDKDDSEYDGLFKRLVSMLTDEESESDAVGEEEGDDEDNSDLDGNTEQGSGHDDEESDSDGDEENDDDEDHSRSPRKRFPNRSQRKYLFQKKQNHDNEDEGSHNDRDDDDDSDEESDSDEDDGDEDHSRSPRKRFPNRSQRKYLFQRKQNHDNDDEGSHNDGDDDDDSDEDRSRSPRKKMFSGKPKLPFPKYRRRNSNSQKNRPGPLFKRYTSPKLGGKRFPKPGRFPLKIFSNKRRSGYRPSSGKRFPPKPMKKIYYKFRRSSTSKSFRFLMQMLKSKAQRKSRIFKIRSILMKMLKNVQNRRSKADQSKSSHQDSSRGTKNYLTKKPSKTGDKTGVISSIKKLLNTLQNKFGKSKNETRNPDKIKCTKKCVLDEKCLDKKNVTKMLQSAPKLCRMCVAKECRNETKRMCFLDAREKCKKVCPEIFKAKNEEDGTCKTCIDECLEDEDDQVESDDDDEDSDDNASAVGDEDDDTTEVGDEYSHGDGDDEEDSDGDDGEVKED